MAEDLSSLTAAMAKSMILLNQRSNIQYAAASIPIFDGEDHTLSVFAQSVEDGLAIIPPNTEAEYLTIVLTKLRGPARIIVQGKSLKTVAELLKHLKKRYAPGRNLTYFQGQIARLKIRRDESLRKYIDRVSHLAHCTRTAIRDRFGNDSKTISAEVEKDLLDSFLDGLPSQVAWRLSYQKVKQETLEDAFEAVLQIERRLKNRRDISDDRSSWCDSEEETSRGRRSREQDYRRTVYLQSPSPARYKKHRFRDRSTSGSEAEFEEYPKRASAMLSRRDNHRPRDHSRDDVEASDHRGDSDGPQLFCWNCGAKGHDGKWCKQTRNRSPRTSPSRKNQHLNFPRAHRTGDSVSESRQDRPKKVSFSNERKTQNY